jgi:hypothetical protein
MFAENASRTPTVNVLYAFSATTWSDLVIQSTWYRYYVDLRIGRRQEVFLDVVEEGRDTLGKIAGFQPEEDGFLLFILCVTEKFAEEWMMVR